MRLLIPVLLLMLLYTVAARGPHERMSQADIDKIRLDKAGFEKTQMIHYNWYLHSIKALMGQLGKDLMKKLDRNSRLDFFRCLDKIADKRDVVTAARCLMDARDEYETVKEQRKRGRSSEIFPSGVGSFKVEKMESPSFVVMKPSKKPKKLKKIRRHSKKNQMKKYFEKKRKSSSIVSRLQMNNQTIILRRVKRSPYRLITDSVSKSDTHTYVVKNMEKAPYLKSPEKSVVQRVSGLIKTMIGVNTTKTADGGSAWSESYKNILRIKKAMDERAKQPGAKVYEMRMLDLVMGRDEPTMSPGEKPLMPPLVQNAYDLINAIEGSPKEVGDSSNIKILSPRFASVMPDKSEVRGKLSPSILSFYNDDAEDQILPIPKLLEATGLQDKDRETVLETVMELSGARQTVDDAMKVLNHMNLFGMEGELKEVTERIAANFKELEKSFTGRQNKEMKKRGFTFMENNQIEELYDKQGIRQHDDVEFDREKYSKLSRLQREESLWLRIHKIAENTTDSPTRSKRWISVLDPTVLAPYMFSPVYGFSVLGPTVLSPSLFSPLILNPAVLSPYVLSPAIAMPFIVSPYLLSPYVISPLVMAPFILTPYVLSPNVINPYVLSPLILSPLVLCPDVISPMVLGGAILSPGVASPSVLSKSVLMANVLSPSVLS